MRICSPLPRRLSALLVASPRLAAALQHGVPGAGSLLSRRAFSALPSHTKMMMPALSPTMTSGTLVKWHKKAGDTIAAGDVIADIATDKVRDFRYLAFACRHAPRPRRPAHTSLSLYSALSLSL